MGALQTILEKGYINDVTESDDKQLLWIELKSYELSSSEYDTLVSINTGEISIGEDLIAELYKAGIFNKVGRSTAGNWCIEVNKSDLSNEELNELAEYVSQNRPIGNTEENRNHIAKQTLVAFSRSK